MHRRLASLLVLIGLLIGALAISAVADARAIDAARASEAFDMHQIAYSIDLPDTGNDMPCHRIGCHCHCNIVLLIEAQAVEESLTHRRTLPNPSTAVPLASRSQAPPLDPPTT